MNVREKRQYTHCAKCGHRAALAPGQYVCVECRGTPGYYHHCAVCGVKWPGGESRDFVCLDCLAHQAAA